ncbi:hypothetical protein B566_EDAN010850 [Ephemera danica]|nr:hypothetical protein B566_EDAN010850 [Ephemera danica]
MVEVTIGWRCEFECAEADVVERLIVDAERLVCVLHELVYRQRRVVRFHHCLRNLYAETPSSQQPLKNYNYKPNSKCETGGKKEHELRAGITLYVFMILSGYSSLIFARSKVPKPLPVPPPSEWTVTSLCFAPRHVHDRFDELSTLCVMTLGPVVACSIETSNFMSSRSDKPSRLLQFYKKMRGVYMWVEWIFRMMLRHRQELITLAAWLSGASWYCWYSETRSFMLLSASVNSISSMPSPVNQCKNALRRNMAVNCSAIRLKMT